jgi:hypothetical protein
LFAGQAFFGVSAVCSRADSWNTVHQTAKPQCSGSAAVFFRAEDKPVLPLTFSLFVDRDHAHDGGARNRRMAARTARTIGPVVAAMASWKVMARA